MRKKLIIILGVTFVVLFIAQALIARLSLQNSFASLNRQQAATNLEQVLNSLFYEADSLARLAQDWAAWDETYVFMSNPDANRLKKNQIAASFEILELEALLYLDNENNLVAGKTYNQDTQEVTDLPNELLEQLQLNLLIENLSLDERHAGILSLPEGPMFIAAAPILTSEQQGPPRGHIVMIRPLETGGIAQYISLRPDRLSFVPLSSSQIEPDLRERLLGLDTTANVVLEKTEGDAFTSYALLPNVFGQPSLMLKVRTPLTSLEEAAGAVRFYFWGTLLIVGVIGILSWLMLDRQVISRVREITRGISQIGSSGSLANRIPQGRGDDELETLSVSINSTLDQLERAQRTLAASEKRFSRSFHASPVGMLLISLENGRYLDANNSLLNRIGYLRKQLLANTTASLPLWDKADLPASRRLRNQEIRYRPRTGVARVGLISTETIELDGRSCLLAVINDITDLTLARQSLAEEKERAQITLAAIADAVVTTDTQGRIEYMNPSAKSLTGLGSPADYGSHVLQCLDLRDERTREPVSIEPFHDESQLTPEDAAVVLHRRDGEEFVVQISSAPIHDISNQLQGYVLTLHDITQLRALSQKLSYQASHDPLTGLINRREFEHRITELVEGLREELQEDNLSHALCYLDLDQFKVVNDSCGHLAGDLLLKQLSALLLEQVRKSDSLARLGGDEFALLLVGCDLDTAQGIAAKLLETINAYRFVWSERTFRVGASIGLVAIDRDSGDLQAIMAAADGACYLAKENGRNRVHVYRGDDSAVTHHRGQIQWAQRIHQALEQDQFELYYQLIEPLRPASVDFIFLELLLRLNGPEGEVIEPARFLPAAERFGLMPAIDCWVIAHAFAALPGLAWYRHMRCSINVSSQSLSDDAFLRFVEEQFKVSDINPQTICFEITENAAITNLSRVETFIGRMKTLGCRFALDDFGSGISSFYYLRNLDIDYLKIDGSFVRNMQAHAIDRAMVESIHNIGRIVGCKTIAEYADSKALRAELAAMGVNYAQGFIDDSRVRPLKDLQSPKVYLGRAWPPPTQKASIVSKETNSKRRGKTAALAKGSKTKALHGAAKDPTA